MSLIYNNSTPSMISYNGISLTEVYYNGVKVWPSVDPIYLLDQWMKNFTNKVLGT